MQDAAGNLYEIVGDWSGGGGNGSAFAFEGPNWGAGYNDDHLLNFNNFSYVGPSATTSGHPVIIARGGNFGQGTFAGIFNASATSSPARNSPGYGLRCVIPR
jgi:hypothetical protein